MEEQMRGRIPGTMQEILQGRIPGKNCSRFPFGGKLAYRDDQAPR